jgi:Ni/Co efflux regulator RcnB
MRQPTVFDAIALLREAAWEHPQDHKLKQQMEEAIVILRLQLPSYRRIFRRYQRGRKAHASSRGHQ